MKQTSVGQVLFSATPAIAIEEALLQPCWWVGDLVEVVEQVENHVEVHCVAADAVVVAEIVVLVVGGAVEAVRLELAESAEIVEVVIVDVEVGAAEIVEVVVVEVVETGEVVAAEAVGNVVVAIAEAVEAVGCVEVV